MSDNDITNRKRRNVLKLTAVSAGSIAIPATIGAGQNENNNTVRALKGTIQSPVQKNHIEQERQAILNQIAKQSNAPSSVVFDGKPVKKVKN